MSGHEITDASYLREDEDVEAETIFEALLLERLVEARRTISAVAYGSLVSLKGTGHGPPEDSDEG